MARAVEAFWIGGPTGNWSEPTNWSTGVVPNETPLTNVTIDANAAQQSVVTLDQHTDIVGLTIDEHDTLNVATGFQIETDAVTVAGNLNLGTATRLFTSEYLWVQPTGRISLTDTPTQV
jgi:hypothetical protein